VGNEQIKKPGAANLWNAVLGGDQEVRAEGHRLPRHHEEVGVVGEDDQDHAGQKDVVLQAEQARRRAFSGSEIARGEDGDARPDRADEQDEKPGERIEPQMKRQLWKPQREHQHLGQSSGLERSPAKEGDPQPQERSDGEEHAGDEADAVRADEAGHAQDQPTGHQEQKSAEAGRRLD
jgi:hypothetical protein